MRGKALFEALTEAAKARGIAVRRESMTRGTSAGGLCVVKGVPTVFVDERGSVEAQIEILAGALRRYDWSAVELPDPVRAVLTKPKA
ncbi:MAG: hypothetical protein U0324_35460 [Polyangiales bacterium]|jgi:hypothetical protein